MRLNIGGLNRLKSDCHDKWFKEVTKRFPNPISLVCMALCHCFFT